MTRKQEIGRRGEDEAAAYLVKRGYRIVQRNYWKPWGELDIIARAKDKTLVFVEVKTIYNNLTNMSNQYIKPEDNLTRAKLVKLQRTAELYANSNDSGVTDKGWRIDLLAIDMAGDRLDIRHYENI